MANSEQLAGTIRAFDLRAVQQVHAGSSGDAMGKAVMPIAVWGEHLRHDASKTQWSNRYCATTIDKQSAVNRARLYLKVWSVYWRREGSVKQMLRYAT